ncbi:MAG: large conductance mechanosensitive channel protein MscL [Bacillota bacterium]|uniref:Large-conductance mechanosensitive channel n=1 Tax=Virgibacillus salarius TaxID=447199 RepID=A0A941DV92_9BACI|nr:MULTISPECIES: large conductance mechanosensitive channel protein MscL [Bacillaceae]NAZ09065.1 large conductance mechanosensitive channel protein MscL [Agaribacter marinus]MBR7796356.1 large conductance mechanosensitive channel protein MscL [Virgibacillus salarius]MCC2251834.1 large conductance mechanosensitive channel protein MscL [Virgibacillus sp. AGTR]MDY7045468.1 large conductance mechanosensitive channel protein MscL [Virgibacillus sp. M23]QRZ16314.1 large conductance mechanosensitive 
MWKDFKEFAFKGNVIDLAVAVVIGAAFSAIVSSLVDNIITPLIGVLMNGVDLTNWKYTVGDAEILYGTFIQSIIDFFIVSLSIFFIIRLLMKFKRKKEEKVVEEAPKVDPQEELLKEIRDLLKEQNKGK